MLMRASTYAFTLATCATLCVATPALANDAAFGGQGAALFPVKETRVKMAAEDIRLRYVPYTSSYTDSEGKKQPFKSWRWQVEAHYTFTNPTDQEVALQLGFPETHCNTEQDECNGDGRFKKMQTWVRGQEVKHTVSKSKRLRKEIPAYDRVYLYEVSFKPKETVAIKHTYLYDGTVSVEGIHADYVTRTGSLWNGPIGDARFTVTVPFTPAYLGYPKSYKLESISPILIEGHGHYQATFHMTQWTPKEDFSLMTASAQTAISEYAHWPFKALNCPTIVAFTEAYDTAKGVAADRFEQEEFDKSFWAPYAKDLRLCRNLPYALWGYTFKDAALGKQLYPKNISPKRSKLPFEQLIDEDDAKADRPYLVIKPVHQAHKDFVNGLLSQAEVRYIKSAKGAEAALKDAKTKAP